MATIKINSPRPQTQSPRTGSTGFRQPTSARYGAPRAAVNPEDVFESDMIRAGIQAGRDLAHQQAATEAQARAHVDQVQRNKDLFDRLAQHDPTIADGTHPRAGYLEGIRDTGGDLAGAYRFVAQEEAHKNAASNAAAAKDKAKADAISQQTTRSKALLDQLSKADPDLAKHPDFAVMQRIAEAGYDVKPMVERYYEDQRKAKKPAAKPSKYASATDAELASGLAAASKGDPANGKPPDPATASALRDELNSRGLGDNGKPDTATPKGKVAAAKAAKDELDAAQAAYDALPESGGFMSRLPGKLGNHAIPEALDRLNKAKAAYAASTGPSTPQASPTPAPTTNPAAAPATPTATGTPPQGPPQPQPVQASQASPGVYRFNDSNGRPYTKTADQLTPDEQRWIQATGQRPSGLMQNTRPNMDVTQGQQGATDPMIESMRAAATAFEIHAGRPPNPRDPKDRAALKTIAAQTYAAQSAPVQQSQPPPAAAEPTHDETPEESPDEEEPE
jgi:hypothetical protein